MFMRLLRRLADEDTAAIAVLCGTPSESLPNCWREAVEPPGQVASKQKQQQHHDEHHRGRGHLALAMASTRMYEDLLPDGDQQQHTAVELALLCIYVYLSWQNF